MSTPFKGFKCYSSKFILGSISQVLHMLSAISGATAPLDAHRWNSPSMHARAQSNSNATEDGAFAVSLGLGGLGRRLAMLVLL